MYKSRARCLTLLVARVIDVTTVHSLMCCYRPAFEDDNKRVVLKCAAPQAAVQAMSRHKELCTFHCVFLFFVAEDLMAAMKKGSVVTVDMCTHVRQPLPATSLLFVKHPSTSVR